jgi:histidine utilization repressor, proteobacterial
MNLEELRLAYSSTTRSSDPAYQRVQELIRTLIAKGIWVEGDRLPSENDLVQALGLSRMTIHRGLRELAASGEMERRSGLGSFVSTPKASAPLFAVQDVAAEVGRRGHQFAARQVFMRAETLVEESRMRSLFGQSHVFHSLIVHSDDGTPIQLEDRFVNPSAAPMYLDQDFSTSTPNEYLTDISPLTRGEHIVEAVVPTKEEHDLLAMEDGDPCLLLRRTTWSGEQVVSVARLLMPGSRRRLVGHFGRGI